MIKINNIHFIKDKIYKKNIIKINFERETKKDEITKLNLISHILLNTSLKYKTPRKLLYETKELYDLQLESFVSIYGKTTVLSFRFAFLKDEFSEKNNGLKAIEFIKELIFNPDIQNGKFNPKSFNQAKNEVIEEIKFKDENKNAYSRKRMLEIMDPDSPISIETCGYLNDLKKINAKNLYEFYLDVIKKSLIDVFSFGNIDESYFKFLKSHNKKLDFVYQGKCSDVKEVIEKESINQSRLIMGYNLNVNHKEAIYPLQIYLYLLGQGPNSKLFKEVREKASLCYSISVTAKSIFSLMMISAGIDANNYQKAVDLINKQVKKMQEGKFSKKDIESAKLVIKSSYQEILENPYAIINSYESKVYLNYDLIKKRFKKIDEVKYEDIINVANKVKLNTIYLLEGKKK